MRKHYFWVGITAVSAFLSGASWQEGNIQKMIVFAVVAFGAAVFSGIKVEITYE